MVTAATGGVDCLRFLLETGADPNTCNEKGDTALHLAVRARYTRVNSD